MCSVERPHITANPPLRRTTGWVGRRKNSLTRSQTSFTTHSLLSVRRCSHWPPGFAEPAIALSRCRAIIREPPKQLHSRADGSGELDVDERAEVQEVLLPHEVEAMKDPRACVTAPDRIPEVHNSCNYSVLLHANLKAQAAKDRYGCKRTAGYGGAVLGHVCIIQRLHMFPNAVPAQAVEQHRWGVSRSCCACPWSRQFCRVDAPSEMGK